MIIINCTAHDTEILVPAAPADQLTMGTDTCVVWDVWHTEADKIPNPPSPLNSRPTPSWRAASHPSCLDPRTAASPTHGTEPPKWAPLCSGTVRPLGALCHCATSTDDRPASIVFHSMLQSTSEMQSQWRDVHAPIHERFVISASNPRARCNLSRLPDPSIPHLLVWAPATQDSDRHPRASPWWLFSRGTMRIRSLRPACSQSRPTRLALLK